MIDASIFERHLDLAPLRGRRRGLVLCIFHRDDIPSLSVDLDRGLFHCFGCGEEGGLRRFAKLVGEAQAHPSSARKLQSPLAAAREEVLRDTCDERWAQPGAIDGYHIGDWIRRRFVLVDRCRGEATAAGDRDAAWDVLDLAARFEREALAIEAEHDDILGIGA